ncbi:MAG TPA: ABC transporter ATP-binding protein [Casimicrobiaceae bacterium]|nr:ABC transporter ATP-binding protein [Casimicrobiaceae bacterium]
MLRATDLVFGFAQRRVGADVSFALAPGETLAVLGGNGAGKTTLLRTLLGLLRPLGGQVTLDGIDVSGMPESERALRAAYVPQSHGPVFGYTVEQMVLMGRAAHLAPLARPGRADHRVANEALERLGIASLARRRVNELSGGERQLALLARALAQQAPVMILDEPTASLDFGNRVRVLQELDRLRAAGLTIVFSTHEPDQARAHADRALLLGHGRPLALDTVERALTPESIMQLFGVPVRIADADGYRVFVPAPQASDASIRNAVPRPR